MTYALCISTIDVVLVLLSRIPKSHNDLSCVAPHLILAAPLYCLFCSSLSHEQMDPIKKREVILPRLYKFVKEHNMTLIMISHELQSIREADKILVMENGRVVEHGSHQVSGRPKNYTYTQR